MSTLNLRAELARVIFNKVLYLECNAAFESVSPSNDLVSIFIPSYNHEEYVEAALKSVCDQTYRNIEIILIDDNSTDDTFKVALTFLKNIDLPYMAIRKGNEKRPAVSINGALQLAYGGWITWLASDDVYAPEKIASQWAVAQESGVDIVLGFAGQMTADGLPVLASDEQRQGFVEHVRILCQDKARMRYETMSQKFSSVYIGWFLARRVFSIVGNLDTTFLTEDYDFNIRLCDTRLKIGYSTSLTGWHRQTRGRLTQQDIDNGPQSFFRVIDKHARSFTERRQLKAQVLVNAALIKRSYGYPLSAMADMVKAMGFAPLIALHTLGKRLIRRLKVSG